MVVDAGGISLDLGWRGWRDDGDGGMMGMEGEGGEEWTCWTAVLNGVVRRRGYVT